MRRALRFAAATALLLGAIGALESAAGPAAARQSPPPGHRISLRRQFHQVPANDCNLPSYDAANRACIRGRSVSQDATEYAFAHSLQGLLPD